MDEKKDANKCPKCGAALSEVITTKSGKKLQRCSTGIWNVETRQTDGCDFVKWLPVEPVTLNEKCPKCGSPLLMTMTRFNKKMKKCSTNVWDPKTKTASGCDFFEWVKTVTEPLDETCPKCENKLVKVTTSNGKQMKKCSTSGWDTATRTATGCDYVEWLK
ncbi:hypothetical protein AUK04_05160 [Candidatus Roizmanbacteria bacterium CG2_30_33_16]|uniref:DNA topoisomerase type IA zn finger domain-containing protein n=5 Tax=Candidatus Roizmaniibacteriota TaxID=1752723 RepID=A0A2M7E4S9_9BACT|nr:hypothetical protein [Candidatus Roizmanbacteria bacterium]OIP82187.1 MAG: hypothetical protein AUK04_05160 [Candidatus Roizmanbacteria bacterium CG2_30_33_16]PIP64532.1 MAG: hypothetical protein COW96_02000 [Candidatus Roizmanbacteria bacterium CG22_combo_CG10-13_8_21_14_all_33_16]PIV62740.1 MAG: hypothetical protein COS12_01265 [Candidatus Roizmanbacteria bacterium CG01_land_8_20_14_3_00_33_9]PIX70631.1 MAG: hypothetical protein COZ39_04480 [Candidatus Roizmanbacteria bacterium CG_4_10_14_